MSSAEATTSTPSTPAAAGRGAQPSARVSQLCRMLLRVRLIIAALAVVLLPSNTRDTRFVVAFLIALISATCAYLLWRRFVGVLQRHPLLMAVDVVVSFVVLLFSHNVGPFLLCTVVTTAIAGLLYRWFGVLYLSVLQVVCYYTVLIMAPGGLVFPSVSVFQGNYLTLVAQPLYYPLVGFIGVWIRRLLDEREAADEARHRAELRAITRDERARLARDMHDTLNKTVRGMAMAAAALPMWVRRDPERAVATATVLATAADAASREARTLLTALRADPDGEGDETVDLAPRVGGAAASWADETGVTTDVTLTASAEVTETVATEVLAIVSEALANVDRHARAENVEVSVAAASGPRGDASSGLVVEIADDGLGFDPGRRTEAKATGHFGLVGMAERAERAGLHLETTSASGAGTTVRLVVPAATVTAYDGDTAYGSAPDPAYDIAPATPPGASAPALPTASPAAPDPGPAVPTPAPPRPVRAPEEGRVEVR